MATEETKPVEREGFEKAEQDIFVRDGHVTGFAIWQASADAALERAETRLRWMGLETAADAIRALKGRE